MEFHPPDAEELMLLGAALAALGLYLIGLGL